MTAPDQAAAVQIANEALGTVDNRDARAVVAALDTAGWLHDPANVAALEAVAAAAQRVRGEWPTGRMPTATDLVFFSAVDALDAAAETGSGEA